MPKAVPKTEIATCPECGQQMTVDTCTNTDPLVLLVNGHPHALQRIRYGATAERWDATEPPERCHDCHVTIGGLHHWGCDLEACPLCGQQLIGCECKDA